MTDSTSTTGESSAGNPYRTQGYCAGWDKIVEPLIARVNQLGGTVEQVKEKFGGLRFYFNNFNSVRSESEWDAFEDQLRDAVAEAARTCEFCGASGRLRVTPHGWMNTLCDKHATENGYKEAT